jgi:hypothetical protein
VIREVDIDRNANTWNYKASTNPGEQADLYEGDESTRTLEIEYARNGLGTQPSPFCGGGGGAERKPARAARDEAGGGQAQLFWQGDARDGQHSDVTIADEDGNTAGCTGSGDDRECTSDIPGVDLVPVKAEEGGVDVWNESSPPMFDLPADLPFEVDFDAQDLDGSADEGISLVRDGVSFTLDDLHLKEGDEQQVNVGDKDIAMDNGSDHPINPTIGYDDLTSGDGYEVTVRATGIDSDAELDLTARPGRRALQLDFDGSGREDVRVITTVTRTSADGDVDKARSRPTTIDGGDGGRLSYGKRAFRDGKLELDV